MATKAAPDVTEYRGITSRADKLLRRQEGLEV